MTIVLFNKVIEIFRCAITVRGKFKHFNYFSHCHLSLTIFLMRNFINDCTYWWSRFCVIKYLTHDLIYKYILHIFYQTLMLSTININKCIFLSLEKKSLSLIILPSSNLPRSTDFISLEACFISLSFSNILRFNVNTCLFLRFKIGLHFFFYLILYQFFRIYINLIYYRFISLFVCFQSSQFLYVYLYCHSSLHIHKWFN